MQIAKRLWASMVFFNWRTYMPEHLKCTSNPLESSKWRQLYTRVTRLNINDTLAILLQTKTINIQLHAFGAFLARFRARVAENLRESMLKTLKIQLSSLPRAGGEKGTGSRDYSQQGILGNSCGWPWYLKLRAHPMMQTCLPVFSGHVLSWTFLELCTQRRR